MVGFTRCLALVLLMAGSASAATLVVDDDNVQCPNASFTMIQAAVVAAAAGDVIEVCPGLYAESVQVPKTLSLMGAGPAATMRTDDPTQEAVVAPPGFLDGFSLLADGIEVSGFTILRASPVTPVAGIRTSDAFSGYLIRGNAIRRFGTAVELHSADGFLSEVSENVFDDSGEAVGDRHPDGPGPFNVLIERNLFRRNVFMIDFAEAMNIEIHRNETPRGEFGIHLFGVIGGAISANSLFLLEANPISLDQSEGLTVDRNRIDDFDMGAGISVGGGSSNITLRQNSITRGGLSGGPSPARGIFIGDASSENVAEGNAIESMSGDGILVTAGATENTIRLNRASDCGRDGIRNDATSSGNVYDRNLMKNNVEHDAHDENRPNNTWIKNKCKTDFPAGTIC